jgi:pimeloyl-ACP methyl ester carboxylesterase
VRTECFARFVVETERLRNGDGSTTIRQLGVSPCRYSVSAVVLGASMGGLLAARVLADFFRTVTVVERDELPDDPANRRGVPQGRHVHVLLPRGAQMLDELFQADARVD